MTKVSFYTIFCFLFLMLFLSFVPRLISIPLEVTPGISSLANELSSMQEELKVITGNENKNQSNIEGNFIRAFRILFVQNLVLIIMGVTIGLLLLMRRNVGKYLALAISFYALGLRFFPHLSSGNIWESLRVKFTIFFRAYPLEVIHQDIVANIIYLTAIIFLLRPLVSKEFTSTQE